MQRTHLALLLLLSSSTLLTSTLAASFAHAGKGAYAPPPVDPAPTAVAPAEIVYDLGAYDPHPSFHPEYGLLPQADPGQYQMANPNHTYDPCPAPQATYDWDRVFKKEDQFGNSTFGAGYWTGITFSSRAGRAGGPDSFTGEALLRAYITVFSANKELARISGKANLTGTHGSSSYFVRILGVDVRSGSASGNLTGNETYDNTFFSKGTTIWIGPFPVGLSGSLNGSVGVEYRAAYEMSTIDLTAKPTGKIYAKATASVDAIVASAGVTGTLTLIQADLPSRAQVIVQPNALAYGLDSDLVLSSLAGRIDAWVKVPGKKWTINIASWDPLYRGTFPITHINSCQNPIVRPVCGDLVCQTGETHDICPSDCAVPPPPPPETEPPVPVYCQAKPWMCEDF